MAHIEIENLTFSYPSAGRPSLSDVSLTIRRGEYVVLCGKSGSGKTTLVSLITRLYDVNVGEVKIFGHNVKDYSSDELYSLFGVAPQKAVLFEGTVRDNIRWGKEDATDEEIEKALVISQSKEFVDNLKDGLDTMINQDGKNLSGGQRQRLTIARALVSNPKILILDDSSSALDFATDAKLRKALNELKKSEKLTSITVSQRATSIKYSDLIIVMDDGKIVGLGTHDDLIYSCDVYREICLSQNKGDDENE